MAKRKRPQAKRKDRTRRTPSEILPTSIGDKKVAWRGLREGVEEVARQGRRLRSKLYHLYRELFPWFREGVIAEKYDPLCETKPEAVQRLYERAEAEWIEATERMDILRGLKPLNGPRAWKRAAVRAGIDKNQTPATPLDELADTVVAWLIDKLPQVRRPVLPPAQEDVPQNSRTGGSNAGENGAQAEPIRKGRRGRRKADYETVQKEAELAEKWERAHEAGTYKADFVKDNGMTVVQLNALLDRVAKRKKPSE